MGPQRREAMAPILGAFRESLQRLGLRMTIKSLDALELILARPVDLHELKVAFAEVKSRFRDEVDAVALLCIPAERKDLYNGATPLFGESVFNAFPSAADDIAEAGKCLALERSTATVFHLMRVTESGLKVLARELEIPYAPSWESYIKQIRANIEQDRSKKDASWMQREPLFKDLLGDFQAMKIAWRNPTMHIDKKFSQEEAENVYGATKSFIKRLADSGLVEQSRVKMET